MTSLIKKELAILYSSPVAVFFLTAFLLSAGLMHWLIPGNYNIIDNGYANMHSFFVLVPVLFMIFIPALTMRSFSEENKTKNLEVFRTRPVSIYKLYISKISVLWFTVNLALISTLVYVYSVYTLSYPVGNIDVHEIIASYISISVLSLVFIAAGLFASSLTKNQFIAFVIAVFLNFLLFYGFDMLLLLTGNVFFRSLGLLSHTEIISRGLAQFSSFIIIFDYVFLFSVLSVFIIELKTRKNKRNFLLSIGVLVLINIGCFNIPDFRFDFTADKRHTLSSYSKEKLAGLFAGNRKLDIAIYLDGELNPGFSRLQQSVRAMVSDLARYSNNSISYKFVNPYSLSGNIDEVHSIMAGLGMNGIVLNETDRQGKTSQRIIYPYALINNGMDTLQINLLKNIGGYSAEENLNTSIQNLEFEFMDAIRLFDKDESESIAFIEGHGEPERWNVYDAEEILSKYYFINRGRIGYDISVLDEFKMVIIAGPTDSFSEHEKFIIDQYIMSGGKVLWLVDGVYISQDELVGNSQSPGIKNETNLDDLLFSYGVRINPVLLQDVQSTSIIVTTGEKNGANAYTEIPWYYSILLVPSQDNPVTKDISLVKALYASSLDIVNKTGKTRKNILLTTSLYTHTVDMPEMVNFNVQQIQADPGYFNQSFLPVAVSLEGNFTSAYTNRFIPDSIFMDGRRFREESITTKMIVVSSSDIIKNEIVSDGFDTRILPMGYDRVSDRIYGNRNFIVNAVNWLVNDSEWMELRFKQQHIRLLDRYKAYSERDFYAVINILLPLFFVWMATGTYYIYRKRKYEK